MIERASHCEACGRGLRFSEREAWPQSFCRPCAAARGLIRLADYSFLRNMYFSATRWPRWWRWTIFLNHALRWSIAEAKETSHG